jgi:hypothetical protein
MDHGAVAEQAEHRGQVSAAQRVQIGLGKFVRIRVISCLSGCHPDHCAQHLLIRTSPPA